MANKVGVITSFKDFMTAFMNDSESCRRRLIDGKFIVCKPKFGFLNDEETRFVILNESLIQKVNECESCYQVCEVLKTSFHQILSPRTEVVKGKIDVDVVDEKGAYVQSVDEQTTVHELVEKVGVMFDYQDVANILYTIDALYASMAVTLELKKALYQAKMQIVKVCDLTSKEELEVLRDLAIECVDKYGTDGCGRSGLAGLKVDFFRFVFERVDLIFSRVCGDLAMLQYGTMHTVDELRERQKHLRSNKCKQQMYYLLAAKTSQQKQEEEKKSEREREIERRQSMPKRKKDPRTKVSKGGSEGSIMEEEVSETVSSETNVSGVESHEMASDKYMQDQVAAMLMETKSSLGAVDSVSESERTEVDEAFLDDGMTVMSLVGGVLGKSLNLNLNVDKDEDSEEMDNFSANEGWDVA